MNRTAILRVDAVLNLVAGLPLVFFPGLVAGLLGLPAPAQPFWPSLLGAVLTGVGVALFMESVRGQRRAIGVGLLGAVCINLCRVAVLVAWLVGGSLALPVRGVIVLWAVAVIGAGLSFAELIMLVGARSDERVG